MQCNEDEESTYTAEAKQRIKLDTPNMHARACACTQSMGFGEKGCAQCTAATLQGQRVASIRPAENFLLASRSPDAYRARSGGGRNRSPCLCQSL